MAEMWHVISCRSGEFQGHVNKEEIFQIICILHAESRLNEVTGERISQEYEMHI